MATAKEVFEALPHVTEVWITKDGEHHLHPNNGGERIERAEKKNEEPVVVKSNINKK